MTKQKRTKERGCRPHLWDMDRDEYWRGVLAEHKASGQSIRGFCATKGINESLFYLWRRTINERDLACQGTSIEGVCVTEKPSPFLPIRVVAEKSAPKQVQHTFEVVLPGKAQVVVNDDTDLVLLAKLLKVLEAEQC